MNSGQASKKELCGGKKCKIKVSKVGVDDDDDDGADE